MGRSENVLHLQPEGSTGTPASTRAAFCLSDLYVDPATGVVRGRGGEVRLEPRVMSVLQTLASEPGTLHTREQLLNTCWPGGQTYGQALTQCIYQLRQQLASAGGESGYRGLVTTVPKRGYQLNAVVKPADPPPGGDCLPVAISMSHEHTQPLPHWPGRLLPPTILSVLVVLVLALLSALLVLLALPIEERSPTAPPEADAKLPVTIVFIASDQITILALQALNQTKA
ncbi:winged helix-turn-helix domain-containing protein [Microbulbifer sp. SA54]|uniref:winged helix-turn-helix domain-containing protein n=1 Tax=Microbulbifer sp. SA54 TaxID=3401577 RepID=UPI003AAD4EEB